MIYIAEIFQKYYNIKKKMFNNQQSAAKLNNCIVVYDSVQCERNQADFKSQIANPE